MAEGRLREGLGAATSLQRGTEAAAFRGEMAGLSIQERQKRLQSQLGQGLANPLAIELAKGFTRLNIQEAYDAAIEALDFQLQKAIESARGRGTLEIERSAFEARYREQVAKLQAQRAIQEFDEDERARRDLETVRGQRESTRAFGAGLAQEQRAARLKAMQADLEAAKKIQAENEAFLKKIGVPAWMLPGVDPRAKQFIEEQKNTLLMGIDETLAKNLFAINQLKTAEEEKQRLIAQATETADLERSRANQEALRQVNELYDVASKTRFELLMQAKAVGSDLSSALDQATAKANALRETMRQPWVSDLPGESFTSRPGQPSQAWSQFFGPAAPGEPGSQQWWAHESWTGKPLPGNEPPGFQHGGFVPGPRGTPRMVMAHGGEAILNEDQQRDIQDVGIHGGRGGIFISMPITVNGSQEDSAILARRIGAEVGKELDRLERRGYGSARRAR